MTAHTNGRELTFGVTLLATLRPADFVSTVLRAEAGGYDLVWVTDSSLHAHSVYPYLALAATATSHVRLGTNCTHPLGAHPATSINAIATIGAIAGGRAILGIGAGGGPTVELGHSRAKVSDIEAMATVARRLYAGETVHHHDDGFELREGRLMHGLADVEPPKIYITASGPRTLEMAGRVADGVLMCCGGSASGLDFALSHVRRGIEASGRRLEDVDVAWHVFGTFDRDPETSHRVGAQAGAMFANAFPSYCALADIPEADVAAVKRAYTGAHHFTEAHAAHRLVTHEMVDRLTVSGDAALWRERLALARDRGITHVELFPLGDVPRVLDALAEEVLADAV